MTICGESTLSKGDNRIRLAVTAFCKAWTCPNCVDRRYRQCLAEIISGRPTRMITLTCRPGSNTTPNQDAHKMAADWKLLRGRLLLEAVRKPDDNPTPIGAEHREGWTRDSQGQVARQVALAPGGFAYFAVFEAHQSGRPHLHLAVRSGRIEWEWLRAQWLDISKSPGVRIDGRPHELIHAGYLAKYLGKDLHRFGTCKRYWKSKNWTVEPRRDVPVLEDAPGNWELQPGNLDRWCRDWTTFEWQVTRVDQHHARAERPP